MIALDQKGQMSVEMVVVLPVVLIVAAVSINVLTFLGDCARFERVCAEAVRVYGASAGFGEYSASTCCENIEGFIEDSFDGQERLEFDVTSTEVGAMFGSDLSDADGLVFSLIPSNRKYVCTMAYSPPFFKNGVFGAVFGDIERKCEFVVDPYQPQGWS